jgi:8-oxo-dGTP diphosphatase
MIEEESVKEIPTAPRLGCAAVIIRNSILLMGRRTKDPERGKWALPGGGVKWGETLGQAVTREVFEETGIVAIPDIICSDLGEIFVPDDHRVIVIFRCKYVTGIIKSGSGMVDVRWISADSLLELIESKDDKESISPFCKEVINKLLLY